MGESGVSTFGAAAAPLLAACVMSALQHPKAPVQRANAIIVYVLLFMKISDFWIVRAVFATWLRSTVLVGPIDKGQAARSRANLCLILGGGVLLLMEMEFLKSEVVHSDCKKESHVPY